MNYNYNYNYGHIICSTPHGDLYWLFDSGEEHYGITESGHHYRRNDTYGYYYIRQFNLTFNAQKMTKPKWRNLEAAVIQNNVDIFKEKITRDNSFGKTKKKDLSQVEIDFDKFMDFILTQEVFESFKLLSKSNSGKMTQKYKWTGKIKPTNRCELIYNYVPGIISLEDNEIQLKFFIGDSIHFITTLSILVDNEVIFEYLFNIKKIDKINYNDLFKILEKELKIEK